MPDVPYALFLHASIRRGTSADSPVVEYGFAPIRNSLALEPSMDEALANLRKNLAAEQIVHVIEQTMQDLPTKEGSE